MNISNEPESVGTGAIVLIFILGFVIRLFACQQTLVINPDGVFYIHQARAIYFGEWHSLTSCHLSFLSSYPFFVAGAYVIFQHWVIAAQFASLCFGSMTLIPLYLLCRRFFDRDVSPLVLLLFASLPVFVAGSAEVVRGPVCWFFLVLGLLFFVKSDETREDLALILSCLFFIMASWARIESALFIIVSLVYLLAVSQKGRIRKLTFFALPLIVVLSVVLFATAFLDKSIIYCLRLHDIVDKLSGPIVAYETLRGGLEDMIKQPVGDITPHFLHKARHLIWLVGLGTLLKYMIRAYFYIFFILFILGIGGMWRRLREDRRIFYLSLTTLATFIVFYLHVLQTWMMFDRFWVIFMLPSFTIIGFGLQKVARMMNTGFHLKKTTAFPVLCLLILALSLPKDFKPREADKMVYREIGEMISQREGNVREIKILKSLRTPDWTPFYANLNYMGAPCPRIDFGMEPTLFDEVVFKDYEVFIGYMKNNSIPYFLWEETAWPTQGFDFLKQKNPDDLKELGSWHHPDVGKIILYSVRS